MELMKDRRSSRHGEAGVVLVKLREASRAGVGVRGGGQTTGGVANKNKMTQDHVLEVGHGEMSPRVKGNKPEVYLRDLLVR
jgi:hypothetical protein